MGRSGGTPTRRLGPAKALDSEAVPAAQALVLARELGAGGVVATANPGHIARFVAVHRWRAVGHAAEEGEREGDGTTWAKTVGVRGG